ncbi:MAG: prolyl oligopeptidase family serine peptidase [Pirellulaceae bacterium]|nr:prolyl oligopeptidase family serine peptidase [Pirellulaceae bacterium]
MKYFSVFWVIAFIVTGVSYAAEPALQALIVDGQNNHNWKGTTPILKTYLEETGLFEVEVATTGKDTSKFQPAFSKYDVIVLNYNGADWPEKTQQDFVEYVKGGGGVVVFHAANNSFPKWKEYNEIIGVGGWGGRNEKDGPYLRYRDGSVVRDTTPGRGGSHGKQHEYVVETIEPTHPVTRGLPKKWLHVADELYDRLRGPAKNVTVLTVAYSDKSTGGTGENEPVLMTIDYGNGRVFHTVMGDNVKQMDCLGFAVTLQRGTEWAATGEVTQEVPKTMPNEEQTLRKSEVEPTPPEASNTSATKADVDLLDRQLFFGNPQIAGGQLSPDGKFISFMKPYQGIMNVWVKEFAEPFEEARPLTNSQRPLYGYTWTEDGKYILYVKDSGGDENMNLFAVDPTAGPEAGKDTPVSRNLTPMKEVTAQIMHASQNNPDLLWVGLNDRDKAWHDLYRLEISTGTLTKVFENTDRITGYEFDWDDNLRLLSRTDVAGNTTLLRKDGEELVPIYETTVEEDARVSGWDATNENFYLITNQGDLDLLTLFKMNPKTKVMELLESDPDQRVDFGGLMLDRNTRKLISTSYTEDQTRHYWRNPTWEANYEFLCDRFPGREIAFQSSTSNYEKSLIAVTGDKYASEAWYFDAKSRELIHQYTPRPELKEVEASLAAMTPIRYPSSDGLEIPAYLSVPVGKEAKDLPVVVLVHGGPKGPRDNWGYSALVQFLANRGYAVLQPNFRASGGYGKKFLNAGDLQWGKLMQDDVTWGVKYLIEKGIADKDRVAIMGGSYGGYATLAGLAFTPDVYACGVDIVGPSNIFTLLDSIPAYWESGRAFLYGMVGDPATEDGKKRIREASPLFSADKISKPLLIIQGANDPRVKQAEADQIAIALRDRGHEVSYLLADDEGHGFRKPVNQMAMFAEIEQFLAEQIGGRYQKEMPVDVAERLEQLRVDVSTVEYEPPAEEE